MALAETARLLVDLSLTGNLGTGLTAAQSSLSKTEAAVSRTGGIGATALGTLGKAAKGAEGAFQHFGGVVSNVAGAAGILGFAGGAFVLSKALTGAISDAENFGFAVEKIAAITGDTAENTSQLVDTLDYFNVSIDNQTRLVGMAEKNLGNLTRTSALAKKYNDEYGLSLTNSAGNVKNFNQLLIDSATYFNDKSIPAQTKAAALAKLYGRNWQELIPILTQGGAAIKAAEDDAINLSATDIANMAKFKDATREWDDAIGDLSIIVGAKLMPALTDVAKSMAAFVRDHSDDIIRFFQSALKAGQAFAGFVTGTVLPTLMGLGRAAETFWSAIPAPLRDMLLKGFVADRAIHFLFGFSPGKIMLDFAGGALANGLKGLVGSLFQRGGTPATPLFVADVTGGLGGGGLAGAAKGVGLGGAAVAGIGIAGIVAAAVVTWNELQKSADRNAAINQANGGNLTSEQIAAIKYQQGDAAYQTAATKHGYGAGSPAVAGGLSGKAADDIAAVKRNTAPGALRDAWTAATRQLTSKAGETAGKLADDVAATKNVLAAVKGAGTSITAGTNRTTAVAHTLVGKAADDIAATRNVATHVDGVRAAADRTTAAVRAKQLSVTLYSSTSISVRDQQHAASIVKSTSWLKQ